MADKITYPAQSTGSTLSAAEFNQIKTAVNGNIDDTVAAKNAADTAQGVATAAQQDIDTHELRTDNPHAVTKAQVGLSNVNNTADANKPISTATQAALDLKRDIASTFLSGGTITFDKDKTYNTYDAPFGGTLSYDLTNAVAGVRATVYFNGSAVPGPAVEEGGNLLAVGQVNKLVFTYLGNSRIVYQITSLNRGTTTDIKLIATGTTTTSTTLGDVGGLSTTLPLNSKFIVEAELMIMCNGAGGVGFAAVFPTLTGINYLLMDGATTNTTYGRQPMSATVGTTKFAAVASATRFPVRIMGYVETTTDGAFKIQFNSTTAGQESTVFIGSWVRFTKVG